MMLQLSTSFLLLLLFVSPSVGGKKNCPSSQTFLIGSYNVSPFRQDFAGKGVTVVRQKGTRLSKAATLPISITKDNPSYVVKHRNAIYFSNSAVPKGTASKIILGNRKNKKYDLSEIKAVYDNDIPDNTRASHINLAKRSNIIFLSNTLGGSVLSYDAGSLKRLDTYQVPIELATKTFPKRQTKPGPHMVYLMNKEKNLIVPDLGADVVHFFRYNRKKGGKDFGKLYFKNRVKLDNGDGPRHVVHHGKTNNIFVVNELSQSVTTLCYNKRSKKYSKCQKFNLLNQGPVQDGTAAAIRITKNQKYLYVSLRLGTRLNPLNGKIIGFKVDQKSGKLVKKIGVFDSGGVHPRDFNIVYNIKVNDNCGDYVAVANRDSSNLIFYPINYGTGKLGAAKLQLDVDTPSSVLQV